jgi:hypothetical protein
MPGWSYLVNDRVDQLAEAATYDDDQVVEQVQVVVVEVSGARSSAGVAARDVPVLDVREAWVRVRGGRIRAFHLADLAAVPRRG